MVKDREAWRAAVHGVAKSWTWLSDLTTTKWDFGPSVAQYLHALLVYQNSNRYNMMLEK